MDFLYRSEAPRYKGDSAPAPQAGGGLFSWLGRMFGSAPPVYRRREVGAPPATPSQTQSWLQASQPQYGAAPASTAPAEPASAVSATCVCVVESPPEAFDDTVPTEIHIW